MTDTHPGMTPDQVTTWATNHPPTPASPEVMPTVRPEPCAVAWRAVPGTDVLPPLGCQRDAWHAGMHAARVDGEPGPAVIRW